MFVHPQTNARIEIYKRVAKTLKSNALLNKFIAADTLESAEYSETLDIDQDILLTETLNLPPEILKRIKEADAMLENWGEKPLALPLKEREEFEEFRKIAQPSVGRMTEIFRGFAELEYYIGKNEYLNTFNYKIADEARHLALKQGCKDNDAFSAAFRVVAFNAYGDCWADLGENADAQRLKQKSKSLCQEHNLDI